MTFAITPVAAKDGNGSSIAGGVDFIDTSGTGAGPWIITKVAIDPAGANTQAILSNSAAKSDLSSIAGVTTATGHGTASGALRVELPTDSTGIIGATQSGTWTVQPGNTANTTAWKVDGSAVTQPISGTVTANAGTNLNTSALATAAKQPALGTAGSASADVITIQGIASGTVVPISDGAGSLTVDGTVSLGAGSQVIGHVIVDSGGGGGTQYTEDAASAADPIGTALNLIRNDGRTGSITSTDGDNIAARGTNSGELYVKHVDAIPVTDNSGSLTVDNGGTFAVQATQAGTWTVQPGNTANTTAWKVDGSAVTQPVSGTVTANAGTGTLAVSLASVPSHAVTNAGTFAVQATVAAGATNIAKAEDVASADADVGVPAMMIRKATPANTSGTDGDYEMLQGSAGRLWVDPSGVTLTVASHAVTNAGTFAVQAACAGDVASGSSDSGNPVKIGGVGKTANPTAVTDGQRVNATFDKLGKQIVVGAIRDLKGITQTSVSNTTSETTIVAAVASTFMDLYGLILANTGASTTKVTIKDSTAGTTRAIIEVPTLETRGFMLPVDSAIPQSAVNNNWTVTCGTATTALEVTAMWVKNI